VTAFRAFAAPPRGGVFTAAPFAFVARDPEDEDGFAVLAVFPKDDDVSFCLVCLAMQFPVWGVRPAAGFGGRDSPRPQGPGIQVESDRTR
jgi:hypothetical protein